MKRQQSESEAAFDPDYAMFELRRSAVRPASDKGQSQQQRKAMDADEYAGQLSQEQSIKQDRLYLAEVEIKTARETVANLRKVIEKMGAEVRNAEVRADANHLSRQQAVAEARAAQAAAERAQGYLKSIVLDAKSLEEAKAIARRGAKL